MEYFNYLIYFLFSENQETTNNLEPGIFFKVDTVNKSLN